MASTTSPQPQQINVTDLDLTQLADVRRQLEEVRRTRMCPFGLPHPSISGTVSPHEFICATEAGAGEVQGMHG